MRAFVEIRKIILKENNLAEQIKQIKNHLSDHDVQLSQIYDAIENLLEEKHLKKNGMSAKELDLRNDFYRCCS